MKKDNIGLKESILLIGISLITTSVISFEILLTRLFSTILMYHFAFLVTSVSIMGIGLGGMLLYLQQNNQHLNKEWIKKGDIGLMLPLSYVVITFSMYQLPYLNSLLIYIIFAIIPYLLAGMLLAKIYKENSIISHKIYFADLIGASIGSLLTIYLLTKYSFIISALFVTLLASIGVVLYEISKKRRNLMKINLLVASLIIILFTQQNILTSIEMNFNAYYTSPNTMMSYLHNSSKEVVAVDYIGWDAMARTDVLETLDENERIIITDGGASAPMLRFDGDIEKVQYLKDDIGFIPFSVGRSDRTLLIGSGGGRDVLYAILGESTDIDAVEINPTTIRAVNQYKTFNGDIYGQEGVNLYIQDGRSFIQSSNGGYDNILLSMVMANAVEYSALALSEGYVFTEEAFNKYFNLLNEEGKLNFIMHSEADLLRGLNTGIKVLLERGVNRTEILDYFVIINGLSISETIDHGGAVHMPLLMIKGTPFTDEEAFEINEIADRQNRQIISLKEYTILEEYEKFSKDTVSLQALYKKGELNLKPVTDSSPYFYNFFRGISSTLMMLIIISVLALSLMYRFIINKEKKTYFNYFIILGIAFMLVEVALIQRMVLFLGNPVKAFSYILFSLLLSGGLGSLASDSSWWKRYGNGRFIPLILIGFFILSQISTMNYALKNLLDLQMEFKLAVVIILIAPLGFLLGMPFPRGIKRLKDEGFENIIPLIWGINGIASVFGAALALTLSIIIGHWVAEVLAGLMYIYIFVFDPFK